jgi:hypothetical protein
MQNALVCQRKGGETWNHEGRTSQKRAYGLFVVVVDSNDSLITL